MNTKIKSLLTAVVVTATNFGIYASQIYETPIVKVDSVDCGDPWSKITVNYTLGGVDAATEYKVAFDITAGGETASVTNDAAKVTNGAATKEIDTATLFGNLPSELRSAAHLRVSAMQRAFVCRPKARTRQVPLNTSMSHKI